MVKMKALNFLALIVCLYKKHDFQCGNVWTSHSHRGKTHSLGKKKISGNTELLNKRLYFGGFIVDFNVKDLADVSHSHTIFSGEKVVMYSQAQSLASEQT